MNFSLKFLWKLSLRVRLPVYNRYVTLGRWKAKQAEADHISSSYS